MCYTCNQPVLLLPSSGSKRRVASAHLALHEAHCLLFLAQCPECKEPVLQAKMDEHCENGHQQVRRPREGRRRVLRGEADSDPCCGRGPGCHGQVSEPCMRQALCSGHSIPRKLRLPCCSRDQPFPYRLMG